MATRKMLKLVDEVDVCEDCYYAIKNNDLSREPNGTVPLNRVPADQLVMNDYDAPRIEGESEYDCPTCGDHVEGDMYYGVFVFQVTEVEG